jgi:hypothetical protein
LINARNATNPRIIRKDRASLLSFNSTSVGNRIDLNKSPLDVENPVDKTIAIIDP